MEKNTLGLSLVISASPRNVLFAEEKNERTSKDPGIDLCDGAAAGKINRAYQKHPFWCQRLKFRSSGISREDRGGEEVAKLEVGEV